MIQFWTPVDHKGQEFKTYVLLYRSYKWPKWHRIPCIVFNSWLAWTSRRFNRTMASLHLRNSLVHHVEAIVLTNWRGDIGDPYPVMIRIWEAIRYPISTEWASFCGFMVWLAHSGWSFRGGIPTVGTWECALDRIYRSKWARRVETHIWLLTLEDLQKRCWRVK